MAEIDFITEVHRSTPRDYIGRVNEADKSKCAEIALNWDEEYWDGERKYGYGGYVYDGRWRAVAKKMINHYDLSKHARILDVGCGKGFLLYEFTQLLPNCEVVGVDISSYAITHAKDQIKGFLQISGAENLPFDDGSFDLVYSINTLHNLLIPEMFSALAEISRVSREKKYLTVEAYRNEREKMNLMYWQLTCRAFHTPTEWNWIFKRADYDGDYGFIYFE